jgi:uncharacterized phage-like protein YoqJ
MMEAFIIQSDQAISRRTSHRNHQPPPRLQDYVTYNVKHSISKVLLYDKLSSDHRAFLTSISEDHEPKTFQEAQSQVV